MEKFRQHVVPIASPPPIEMEDLYQWSVKHPEDFWKAFLSFSKISVEGKLDPVLKEAARFQDTAWFPNLRLNFTETLLAKPDGKTALVYWGEDAQRKEWGFADLRHHVSCLAHALKKLGITSGTSVAACLPNSPEAVAAYLASVSLGACWSAASADFSASALIERFTLVKPKVLFCTDGYLFQGGKISCMDTLAQVCRKVPSITHIICIPHIHEGIFPPGMPKILHYASILKERAAPLAFEKFPFDHPLCVAFTSGTSGVPKPVVHRAGGVLLEHIKEISLHTDIREGDRVFFQASCGSAMWYWLTSALAQGACLVLYDGSLDMHDGRIALELIEQERVTVFGAHPKFFAHAEKLDVQAGKGWKPDALHTVLSTGGPLHPEQYDYLYQHWSNSLCVSSLASNTDMLGCFALGSPLSAVYRGEVQCRSLGLNVQVWNEEGHQVRAEQGELVCTNPFPSQPLGFLGDAQGEQYFQEYFSRFPERNVWSQGDIAELTPSQGLIMYGRSNATITSDGIRIGTSEIYRQVENQPEVREALVIGLPQEGGRPKIILFVVLKKGQTLTEALSSRLETCLRTGVTTSHVPNKIFAVSDLPKSHGGKLAEVLVRDLFEGKRVDERFLVNAECLEVLRKLRWEV